MASRKRKRGRRSASPDTLPTAVSRRRLLAATAGGVVFGGALAALSLLDARDGDAPADIAAPTAAPKSAGAAPTASVSSTPASPNVTVPTAAFSATGGAIGLAAHQKGNPNAAVVVLDFSSYTCPHCRDFALNTEPTIDKLHVATGNILFEFRHSPLDNNAARASEAVESAGSQGDFWGYHHQLMDRQPQLARSGYPDGDLIAIAGDLGLDIRAFTAELESGKYQDKIDADINEAIARGLRSVPTFFINEERIIGNQGPLILDTIDEQLAVAGNAR